MSKVPKPSLLEQARAGAILPGPKCDVQRMLHTVPELTDEITELLRSHDVPHAATARVLSDATGVEVEADTIGRHRRGQCVNCRKVGHAW
jgi:hypothetical protein